jgi:hypothetical protein
MSAATVSRTFLAAAALASALFALRAAHPTCLPQGFAEEWLVFLAPGAFCALAASTWLQATWAGTTGWTKWTAIGIATGLAGFIGCSVALGAAALAAPTAACS